MLVGVELGLARTERIWALVPQSNSGVVDALEQRVIAPAPEPRVVVFGSSRARDAVIPRQLEEELGLPPKTVLNLGLTAGTPFDALVLYRRNREKLSKAGLVMLALEDWHFNARIAPNARERRFATLGERFGVFDLSSTLSLMVGWGWRTYDARKPAQDAVAALLGHRGFEFPIASDGRVIWRDKETDVGPERSDAVERARQFYLPFELSAGRERQIQRFVELAQADGARVMVLRVPWRDAYVEYVSKHHRAELELTNQALRRVAADDALIFERASALGISETSFYDYGHMTPVGARKLTRQLASRIRSKFGAAVAKR